MTLQVGQAERNTDDKFIFTAPNLASQLSHIGLLPAKDIVEISLFHILASDCPNSTMLTAVAQPYNN